MRRWVAGALEAVAVRVIALAFIGLALCGLPFMLWAARRDQRS